MQDQILCPAIHYFKERFSIPSHPKNITTGYVMTGHRHPSIISLHYDLTGKKTGPSNSTQGFLTIQNRFVGRQEGYRIAEEVDQIDKGRSKTPGSLYSEDLY